MKKNQSQLFAAKALSSKEMKQVKGGTIIVLYECAVGFDCYATLASCRAFCPRVNGCRWVRACRL